MNLNIRLKSHVRNIPTGANSPQFNMIPIELTQQIRVEFKISILSSFKKAFHLNLSAKFQGNKIGNK